MLRGEAELTRKTVFWLILRRRIDGKTDCKKLNRNGAAASRFSLSATRVKLPGAMSGTWLNRVVQIREQLEAPLDPKQFGIK